MIWIIRCGQTWWNNDHGWCDDRVLATHFNGKPHSHPPEVSLPIGQSVHWDRLHHEDPKVHDLIEAVNVLMSNSYDCDAHMDMDRGVEHEDYAAVSAALEAFNG